MATYKVIQDIEAEDTFIGPLTLRQCIYGGIAALSGYLGVVCVTKGAAFMIAVFLPITAICGFFAFPWRQDQPTEVWALAKIRFMLKPRKRIWDQTGIQELVSITAPKVIERRLTNGLTQDEVHSRLSALASTIDSRGWAVKNANVNLIAPGAGQVTDTMSDRLVPANTLPQEVSDIDIHASDDILDAAANPVAHNFDSMIAAADTAHRQQIIAQLEEPSVPPPSLNPLIPQPTTSQQHQVTPTPSPKALVPPMQAPQPTTTQPSADYWFLQGPAPAATTPGQAVFGSDPLIFPGSTSQAGGPQAATPTPEEEAMVKKLREEYDHSSMTAAYGHMKTLRTPEQLAEEARKAVAVATAVKPKVTPRDQAAIINLANNDDLDVATIARQAHEQVSSDNGEVVISLH